MDDVISGVDLASLLGVNMTEIPSLIEQGLPYIQIGDKRLFLKSSVIAWLRQGELPSRKVKVESKSEPMLKIGHENSSPVKLAQPRGFEV